MKAYDDYPPYKYPSPLNDYTPSCWVIVKFTSPEHGVIYKVLAGGGGGYLNGHTWKLSSGITKVEMAFDEMTPIEMLDRDKDRVKNYLLAQLSGEYL